MADIVSIDSRGSITKRDIFAAAALQGILSNPAHCKMSHTDVTQMAFEIADEMIADRNGNGGQS